LNSLLALSGGSSGWFGCVGERVAKLSFRMCAFVLWVGVTRMDHGNICRFSAEFFSFWQLEKIARLEECEQKLSMKECELQETQREEMTLKAEAKKNNPLTFAVPIVVTTALSGVVLQFIKK
jgi:hypothetical protein